MSSPTRRPGRELAWPRGVPGQIDDVCARVMLSIFLVGRAQASNLSQCRTAIVCPIRW